MKSECCEEVEIPDWGCKYPFAHFQGGQVPPLPIPGGARVGETGAQWNTLEFDTQ